jgi:hypothetical protein
MAENGIRRGGLGLMISFEMPLRDMGHIFGRVILMSRYTISKITVNATALSRGSGLGKLSDTFLFHSIAT